MPVRCMFMVKNGVLEFDTRAASGFGAVEFVLVGASKCVSEDCCSQFGNLVGTLIR
jgi:hypothetical protein